MKASLGDSGAAIFQEWCKFDFDDHEMWLEWEDVETRPGISITSVLVLAREAGWDGEESGGTQETPSPSRVYLIPFGSIRLNTRRRDIVQGLFPRDGLTVLWGAPKCGKSFLALDIGLHVANGWEYRGRKVQQGPVVLCAFEGGRELRRASRPGDSNS